MLVKESGYDNKETWRDMVFALWAHWFSILHSKKEGREMIKSTQWRVTKHAGETSPWYLESQSMLTDGMATPWGRIGRYRTRKAAITVGMLMRERGERITWPGSAIRMGIALVSSC